MIGAISLSCQAQTVHLKYKTNKATATQVVAKEATLFSVLYAGSSL